MPSESEAMMFGFWSAALVLGLLSAPAVTKAQARQSRERHEREWEVKARKMEERLLPTMRQHRVDMWIVMSRENHPDPILDLFGGYGVSGWYGHRNAYIFYDPGPTEPLETTVLGTHLSDHLSRFYVNIVGYGEEGLAPLLRRHVEERDPQTIAINESRTISMADGLSSSLKAYLVDAIGERYADRLVSSEPLAIDYISYRTREEIEIEREASHITYNILRRAFSNEVVTPGTTTLMDVHWWIVDEWKAQDLELNFPPHLELQRRGHEQSIDDADNPVIRPGDLLHVDFGIRLMGLVTDQQKMAYVLHPGEVEAPQQMQLAFTQSRRLGEIVCEELKPGVAGYVVKQRAEERALGEGILNSVYPHAQGNWVHGAGAWVSFDWPERYGQHPREPVRAREIWSIEYSTSLDLDIWDGQRISMLREEDAWVDDAGDVHYFAGPQEELWVIRSAR
jgi:Xaa-Pro aminopeptidase